MADTPKNVETTQKNVAAAFAALREPFPASVVGKLPRIVCTPCSRASGKVCDEHTKKRCNVCNNFITERHIHLDFVGHAPVTDRLLSIDPQWSWDFGCLDPASGLPSKEASIERDEKGNPVALWMALTVCGVTRRDVGYVEYGKAEPMKLLVSDAISRCAMRFGVALDLWAKDGLESHQVEAPAGVDPSTGEVPRDPLVEARQHLYERIRALSPEQREKVRAYCDEHKIPRAPGHMDLDQLAAVGVVVDQVCIAATQDEAAKAPQSAPEPSQPPETGNHPTPAPAEPQSTDAEAEDGRWVAAVDVVAEMTGSAILADLRARGLTTTGSAGDRAHRLAQALVDGPVPAA